MCFFLYEVTMVSLYRTKSSKGPDGEVVHDMKYFIWLIIQLFCYLKFIFICSISGLY